MPGEVIPVVWTHLTLDLVDPGRCRSLWHGPRSTVRSCGLTRVRCSRLQPAAGHVAADLNVSLDTRRTWVRDAGGRPASAGTSQDTEAELARLRAENVCLVLQSHFVI